jgi:hypothetical protein
LTGLYHFDFGTAHIDARNVVPQTGKACRTHGAYISKAEYTD